MAQPNKGQRRLINFRVPEQLHTFVARYALERNLSVSEAAADLIATTARVPLPSTTLPQAKNAPTRRKGHRIICRVPEHLHSFVAGYARDQRLSINKAAADLIASTAGIPLPSKTKAEVAIPNRDVVPRAHIEVDGGGLAGLSDSDLAALISSVLEERAASSLNPHLLNLLRAALIEAHSAKHQT